MAHKGDGGDGKDLEKLGGNKVIMDQQINVARSELKNIRQQIHSLGHVHKKEMEKIKDILKMPEMFLLQEPPNLLEGNRVTTSEQQQPPPDTSAQPDSSVSFSVIGHITSWFTEKRGTPRQPGIGKDSRGKFTLNKGLFTNPEHTLDGLAGFSHIWIIFHFHKNSPGHVKAKVAPPRLNGERVGVFGTRSPHRPCPIGLSLVKIEKIEGDSIYFSGVDVVDGTPVLDIKPYIPHYDSPWCVGQEVDEDPGNIGPLGLFRSPGMGCSNDEEPTSSTTLGTPSKSINTREEPDGEEEVSGAAGGSSNVLTHLKNGDTPVVRVPSWIEQPPIMRLNVRFSERAVIQLVENTDDTKSVVSAISSVLREDPRSVYLRERWASHFYTFLIKELHISCKFDDQAKVVTVFQVKPSKKCDICGEMEWQCTNTGSCEAKKN